MALITYDEQEINTDNINRITKIFTVKNKNKTYYMYNMILDGEVFKSKAFKTNTLATTDRNNIISQS